MSKIEAIRPLYLVHSFAAVILAATIALFGYELSKPKIQRVEASVSTCKVSALAAVGPNPVITHRLPTLSERFQRKVLVYSVRKKVAASGHSGKAYMAMMLPRQR